MGSFCSRQEESSRTERVLQNKNIELLVLHLLQNKKNNISWLPDSIEKKMYQDLLELVIHDLEFLIKTVKIQYLDHEITLNLNPIPQEEESISS
jgi:hypothetical protein